MNNIKQGLRTVPTIIIILVVIIVAGFLYNYFNNQAQKAAEDQKNALIKQPKIVTISLNELNDSGISGTARLVEAGEKTEVALSMNTAAQAKSRPAHIHKGTCASTGEVVYPLSNVEKGISETILDVPFDTILASLPLLINVHESAAKIQNYVACGDFPGNEKAAAQSEKTFDISAKNFSFSMNEIRVKKGDTVTINLESTDGFHNWTLDEFNARTPQINTGGKTSVTFIADKAGSFEYYCSIGSHRQMGMKGTLVVE